MVLFGRKTAAFVLGSIALCVASATLGQDFLPAPPSDHALIYALDEANRLTPLPFEIGQTPLKTEAVAKNTKVSYVELKGEHAMMTLNSAPRIFLFTSQRQLTHPPFIVWLTPRHGVRRATAVAQRGLTGFAIESSQIAKPIVRVLNSFGDEVFMELRPRTSLEAGEYAIIGEDLKRIATFRVTTVAMP